MRRTFLENHIGDIAATDFYVVPAARFRLLYCVIGLRHGHPPVLPNDALSYQGTHCLRRERGYLAYSQVGLRGFEFRRTIFLI